MRGPWGGLNLAPKAETASLMTPPWNVTAFGCWLHGGWQNERVGPGTLGPPWQHKLLRTMHFAPEHWSCTRRRKRYVEGLHRRHESIALECNP